MAHWLGSCSEQNVFFAYFTSAACGTFMQSFFMTWYPSWMCCFSKKDSVCMMERRCLSCTGREREGESDLKYKSDVVADECGTS